MSLKEFLIWYKRAYGKGVNMLSMWCSASYLTGYAAAAQDSCDPNGAELAKHAKNFMVAVNMLADLHTQAGKEKCPKTLNQPQVQVTSAHCRRGILMSLRKKLRSKKSVTAFAVVACPGVQIAGR